MLGGFAATVDGVAVSDRAWRLRKARELVKMLALARGNRLHTEQLMDALWPDRDPVAAANNLHQAVHAARRALGRETIELRDGLLVLCAAVDVTAFEQAAVEARRVGTAGAYRAALDLHRGELLPENRYDDWAAGHRDKFDELHGTLLAGLERLGGVRGFRGLPAETSSFVGREHELASLRGLVHRARLLTLTGPGGAGKTRLALALARAVEGSFADGAALVELASVVAPGGVEDAVSASLDIRALPGRSPLETVADFVAVRNLLLVFDNCEHVLDESGRLVEALLRAAPSLTVVATSREPLRAGGETVFHVPPLAIPDIDGDKSVLDLVRFESVQLFVERAAAASPGFVLAASNAFDVARICSRLDGLPLALELAAARVGALGTEVIAERLDDRFALLRASGAAAPVRQRTLDATLEWSHELLEPAERVLFRRLAAFAGSFDLRAVEQVCAGGEPPLAEIADLLARLVEKSLVTVEPDAGPRRYRLLESVQLFAARRLEEAGEDPDIRDAHAAWALRLAEAERDSARLDDDAANVGAALERLIERSPTAALRLCVTLGPFWLRRMELREANRALREALAAAPEHAPERAAALLTAAGLNLRGGDPARGFAYAEQSLDAAAATGDVSASWRALQLLGEYELTYGQVSVGLGRLEQALEVAQRNGLAAEEALGVYSLAVARWLARDPDAEQLLDRSVGLFEAVERSGRPVPAPLNLAETRTELRVVLEETLQPFVEVSCASALAYVRANQASIARSRGDLADARALLDESAERFARLGDEHGRAHVLSRQGFVELAAGKVDEARSCLTGALELRRALHERRGIGLALTGLALVETEAGEHTRAEAHLTEATDLFRRTGDRWGLINALWRKADLAVAANAPDQAEASLREALDLLHETRLERWIAHTLAALAEVSLLRGDEAGAVEQLADASERYRRAADPAGLAAVRSRLESLAEPLQS